MVTDTPGDDRDSNPAPAAGPVVLLDLDGVIAQPVYWPNFDPNFGLPTGSFESLEEILWIPQDGTRIIYPDMLASAEVHSWYRRAPVDTLLELAQAGARIVWHSTWLIVPDRLAELAVLVGLGFVELPDVTLMPTPPVNVAVSDNRYLYSQRWKVLEARRRASNGTRVVWVDDQLWLPPSMASSRRLPTLSSLPIDGRKGLQDADLERLHRRGGGEDGEWSRRHGKSLAGYKVSPHEQG